MSAPAAAAAAAVAVAAAATSVPLESTSKTMATAATAATTMKSQPPPSLDHRDVKPQSLAMVFIETMVHETLLRMNAFTCGELTMIAKAMAHMKIRHVSLFSMLETSIVAAYKKGNTYTLYRIDSQCVKCLSGGCIFSNLL